jgi:tRNA G10  N-methylase Trm11
MAKMSNLQNTYMFICGKNWKLSLAELTSYLDARGCKFAVSGFSRAFFFIKTEQPLEVSVIEELGGELKLSKTSAFAPSELVNEAFVKDHKDAKKRLTALLPFEALAEQMPQAESGKAVFGVSVYWEQPEFRAVAHRVDRALGSALKDALKAQGKKARFMGFPRDRESPQLTPVEVLKQGLVETNAEVLFCVGKTDTSIGSTFAVHNPFDFQKRDIDKPVQRKIFGISPRVAKIMLNLGHLAAGKTFLDPFCGVGTLLQEALLAKAKVIGSDMNRWCVEGARRNLAWVAQEYDLLDADYTVMQGDARNLTQKIRNEVDCIATEPDLGPALKEVPTGPYAQKIIDNLNPLFDDFLTDSYEVLKTGGFLVLVTPYIRTRAGKPVVMNVQEMAQNVGYTTVKPFEDVAFVDSVQDFPLKDMTAFIDMDERHKIGRQINIFQKSA